MASLSDGGVLLCLLPPSPGLGHRKHGERWGGSDIAQLGVQHI